MVGGRSLNEGGFAFLGTQFDDILADYKRTLEPEAAACIGFASDEDRRRHEVLFETRGGKFVSLRLEQFGPGPGERWFDRAVEHRGLNRLTLQSHRSGSEIEQHWPERDDHQGLGRE